MATSTSMPTVKIAGTGCTPCVVARVYRPTVSSIATFSKKFCSATAQPLPIERRRIFWRQREECRKLKFGRSIGLYFNNIRIVADRQAITIDCMSGVKKLRTLALVLFLPLIYPATAGAACTVDQRVELSKAGYNKTEIERMCASPAKTTTNAPEPVNTSVEAGDPDSIDSLNRGSIVGSSSKDYQKRRCKLVKEGVEFKKKGLVPYEKIRISSKRKIDDRAREMLVVVGLNSGFNTEGCILMRVDKWRYKKNETVFETDSAMYSAEYDNALARLKALGARPE